MIYYAEKNLFYYATNQRNLVGVLWLRTLCTPRARCLCGYINAL